MAELKSSNLAAADYSAETRSMTVTFRNGGVYTYAGVPETVYDELVAASSPGAFLAERIKGKYSFVKG